MLQTLLPAVGSFAIYFLVALAFLAIFKFIYALVTPHDEWKLIKEEKSTAAAIAFGGAILGFSLAISGAISNSVSIIDFVIWAVIATLAQIVAFGLVRFVYMPKIVERIHDGEVSAGIMVAVTSVAIGLLNAACMTY